MKTMTTILSALFSERVCLAVTAAGATASFFFGATDQPVKCAATVAVMLPWFLKAIRYTE